MEDLEELCGLIETLDAVDTLNSNETAFTLFAPTNEALEAVADVVSDIDSDKLEEIVLYHVTAGAVYAADLVCEAGENLVLMANMKESRTLCDKEEAYYQKGKGNARDEIGRAHV